MFDQAFSTLVFHKVRYLPGKRRNKAMMPKYKITFSLSLSLAYIQPPARLLIQVPRFGKQFKTYQKIVPDLSLDVMDLVDSSCKNL